MEFLSLNYQLCVFLTWWFLRFFTGLGKNWMRRISKISTRNVRKALCRKLIGHILGVLYMYTQFQPPKLKKHKTMKVYNIDGSNFCIQAESCWKETPWNCVFNQEFFSRNENFSVSFHFTGGMVSRRNYFQDEDCENLNLQRLSTISDQLRSRNFTCTFYKSEELQ